MIKNANSTAVDDGGTSALPGIEQEKIPDQSPDLIAVVDGAPSAVQCNELDKPDKYPEETSV